MIKNNIMCEKTCGILIIITLILSACATQPKKEIIKTEPIREIEPVLPIDAVDRKISALENLLLNNMVQEKDRGLVATLISDYYKIKALSQGDQSQDDYKEIIMTLFNNLSQLDEKYILIQGQVADEIYAKALNDLYLKKKSIIEKYASKDYGSVLSECGELEETFGKDSMSFEISILLAMSLAEEGRMPEAITLGDEIIEEMEGRPDLIRLRAELIKWRIDTENKGNVFEEYKKLVEKINEKQSILENITNLVNSQNKKLSESDQILNRLMDKKSYPDFISRITGGLKEIENLKSQGDFTGARLLLLKWKMRTDMPTEITEIDKALDSLDLSEKQYQERLKTDKQEAVSAAMKLIEEEDYESAITILDNVKNGGKSSPEIEEQRNIAIEKLINKERNRAAKKFLAAKKTDDIKKKKELILSVQNILNGLIEKYPSSPSIEQVKGHLGSVNEELGRIENQR